MTQLDNIETDRLLIRPLKRSDWKMISFLRTNKIVNQFIKRQNANSKGKALEFILKINTSINNKQLCYWAITEKVEQKMIGTICLWNFSKDKKTAEIGFDLSPEFHRKGLMTESVKAIIQFGFKTLQLNSIEAYTHKDNLGSIKLLEKSNFKLTDRTVNHDVLNTIVYELKNEQF